MFKNDMGFQKFKNINISIELHSFVCYNPWDVHRIVDKLKNARYDYLSAILWTSQGL